MTALDGPLAGLAADARRDRLVVGRGLTDEGSMRDTIWAAFRDEVASWAELDYVQDVVAPRVLASVRDAPDDRRPAFVLVSNPALFDRAGLVDPLETPFHDRFPGGWIDPDGRWVPLYVQPIVAIHNAWRVGPPRRWEDLADPSRPNHLVFDDPARMLTAGPAFAELRSTMGDGPWADWVRALGERRPMLVADNERAVLEVSTGARWTGLSNWNVARRVRPGSPVRHTYLSPTPCIPGFGLLVRGAPGASLARLFLTWLTSDSGQRAYARTGRIPAQPNVDAALSLAAILPRGVEPVYGTADWLTDPEPWADRYRELLPAQREVAREGKLR